MATVSLGQKLPIDVVAVFVTFNMNPNIQYALQHLTVSLNHTTCYVLYKTRRKKTDTFW